MTRDELIERMARAAELAFLDPTVPRPNANPAAPDETLDYRP